MLFGPRIRRLGAALGLAWAGPLLAEPIDAECHLLRRLAVLPPYLDRLADGVEGPEADALIAFEEALWGVPPTLVAEIAASDELADHAAPLIGYALALQALRRPAAAGEHAALGDAAMSPGMRSAVSLIEQLIDERDCRSTARGARGGGAGAAVASRASSDEAAAPEERASATSTPRTADPLGLAAAALLAGASAALLLVRALLRWRPRPSRRHRRGACRCWTTVERDGEVHRSLIVDVSRLGCQVTAPSGLRRGQEVAVGVPGGSVPARVMWRGEHFAGLRFASALDDAQLAAIRRAKADFSSPAAAAGPGAEDTGARPDAA